ncbi:class I SAM-dependent methyltransferase [Actinosynnema mirum]|uniref:Methyltransferase type 11 n=1 Tax=Actinosynnema mirum (strain ATCC 29888 / DSM 43827 / JCM 3225 / NBRC 14064 / NCIMB 13271 / NRRL B-12336 / IMRU 3971 / 101) TaxID=446462 RepID=C6WEK3_ACTMD|nr:methyltransferase domain-containing protein [Actinosynnema mirum]ACU37803.1 Methyltransferase type 11 [Actinosynnema mirum DSM 43827]
MTGEPRPGDAFGEVLRAALAQHRGQEQARSIGGLRPRPVVEIVERDDGFIRGGPAAWYLAGPEEWWPSERKALERIEGRVLDIGAGAGRVALALQERGVDVTALDPSGGAVEVALELGVRSVVQETVEGHLPSGERYDSFVLFGNNLGLLGPREHAHRFLADLAALARPGARVFAQGTDPHHSNDPLNLAYHERNRERGRLPGLYRQRVRFRDLATGYLDYLLCSAAELEELVAGTGWALVDVDEQDAPLLVATLVREG